MLDGNEIWRRSGDKDWSLVAKISTPLISISTVKDVVYGGTMGGARLVKTHSDGKTEFVLGFDQVEDRSAWIPVGPPIHVRAISSTSDGKAIIAAVHVGGMPLSEDGGKSWRPTIPIRDDVHQVKGHPTISNLMAAAAAAGLYVTEDRGRSWTLYKDGLQTPSYCLAVAHLKDEILFSHEDGPFAKQSQVWKWSMKTRKLEQVRDGLPEWLEGKVDTNFLSSKDEQVAVLDGGGNLWFSRSGSRSWKQVAKHVKSNGAGIVVI